MRRQFVHDYTDRAGNTHHSEGYSYTHFAEVSALGAVPLLVPTAMAALVAWCAWRQRPAAATGVAVLSLIYSFVTGFSIGGAYWLPGFILMGSASLAIVAAAFESP